MPASVDVIDGERLRAAGRPQINLSETRAQFEAAPRSATATATLFDTRKTVTQSQLGLIHEHRLAGGDRLRLVVYGGERDTQSNIGGRSIFRNAGATDRRGLELAWSAALAPAWQVQLSQTWLDARFRDGLSAGNRIPGTAHSVFGAEIAWQPAQGWCAGVESRRSGPAGSPLRGFGDRQ